MTPAVLRGACLCGAVRIEVGDPPGWVGVCHCGMCRTWSGTAFACFPAKAVHVTGAVATYRSSAFAERGFCPACGTHLWMRDVDGDTYDLMPGPFPDTAGWALRSEIYCDRAPNWLRLAGTHKRATAEDYEARNRSVPEGAPGG